MAQNDLVVALQRSTVAIQKLKKQLAAYHEPIAIVGMGCRFPGPDGSTVDTPAQFWQNLRNGVDAITETPASRWKLDDYYDPDIHTPGKTHIRHGGFMDGVDQFDPAFFRLSPREVVAMDPQHRLLLETTWEALEYANLLPKTLMNQPVGVFIGFTSSNEYVGLSPFDNLTNLHAATGVAGSTAAGRISYLLGLTGPCLAVDTACSSSLTAIHLACQSLRTGECDAAVAGG
ncbi:MAG: beta-ketoacyl synthase N-terminal-like domain-containing protein, partial [Caldilinea sp.]